MATGQSLPKHIEIMARTGVLTPAVKVASMPMSRVALTINSSLPQETLVDLGGMPIPTEQPKVVHDMIEKSLLVKPKDWYLSTSISQNLIDDDQTGQLRTKFQNVGSSFLRYLNTRVFQTLNGGDGTTYGLCYDGQDFFDSDHADPGADYNTAQDNEYALALSQDNFETVWVAAQNTVDDKGNFTEYSYDLLVVNPVNMRIAANITGNSMAMDTANNELNPFDGQVSYMTNPNLDTTAWHVIASNESTKPILVVVRKAPTLTGIKFEAQEEDGGKWIFTYHARDVVVYGDWRLAYQGNT